MHTALLFIQQGWLAGRFFIAGMHGRNIPAARLTGVVSAGTYVQCSNVRCQKRNTGMDFTLGFVAGSFLGPLVLFAIASIVIICALQYENGWLPTLVVGGSLLALHYLFGIPV